MRYSSVIVIKCKACNVVDDGGVLCCYINRSVIMPRLPAVHILLLLLNIIKLMARSSTNRVSLCLLVLHYVSWMSCLISTLHEQVLTTEKICSSSWAHFKRIASLKLNENVPFFFLFFTRMK